MLKPKKKRRRCQKNSESPARQPWEAGIRRPREFEDSNDEESPKKMKVRANKEDSPRKKAQEAEKPKSTSQTSKIT